MIRKYTRRYRTWQNGVRAASPFVVLCGIVAIAYFFYRIVLVVSPAVVLEERTLHPVSNVPIVCSEDEGSTLKDPTPILSASYQKRIGQQRALSANKVTNSNLLQINSATGQPVGYSHSVENGNTQYDYLKNGSGAPFLRVTSTKKPAANASPEWQLAPISIQSGRTYAYSFWYRSSTPVDVSMEYTTADGIHYADVTSLAATNAWQQFTSYFDNTENAKNFRVDIAMTTAGHVDTRAFDVHEIPDATLSAGIVSITFDDGWQSSSDLALPLLSKYHIRTTQYIISQVAAQNVAEYMSIATIQRLKRSGQEIGSHTLTHCNQTQLGPADLQANAAKGKQMLEGEQLGPIKSFAYPLGQYNAKTQAVYEKYYPLIRSSDFGYNDRYFDETDIHSIGVLNTTSDKEFQSWLNYAKKHKLWVVLVYHRVDATGEYSVTHAQLERQLKMIVAGGLKTLPLSEAAAAIR